MKNPFFQKKQRLYIDALEAFRPKTTVLYGHYLAKALQVHPVLLLFRDIDSEKLIS